jgi:hypothetical protein
LISGLDGGEWSAAGSSSRDTHWTEGWVGLRTGVDTVEEMEMDAVSSSETRSYNPEDHNTNLHLWEHHKYYKIVIFYQFSLNNIRGGQINYTDAASV